MCLILCQYIILYPTPTYYKIEIYKKKEKEKGCFEFINIFARSWNLEALQGIITLARRTFSL